MAGTAGSSDPVQQYDADGWMMGNFIGNMTLAILVFDFLASSATFAVYAADKSAARQGQQRVPEKALHLLALVGGWPGALAAQKILHHKTRKQPFQMFFWCTVLLHCGALVWLSYSYVN